MIKVIKSVYNAYDILISESIMYVSIKQYEALKKEERKAEESIRAYFIHYEKA